MKLISKAVNAYIETVKQENIPMYMYGGNLMQAAPYSQYLAKKLAR